MRWNALGEAILRSRRLVEVEPWLTPGFEHNGAQRSVVLIDEIDKAPRDFPNDLLNEVEHLYFRVAELGNEADEEAVQLAPIRPLRIHRGKGAVTALWQWSKRPRVAALLLLALSLAAVGVYRAVITKPKPPDEVAKNEAPTPAPAPATPLPFATIPAVATPTPNTIPDATPVNRSLWPAAIPLLLYAAWFLWRWWRRKLMLERMQTSSAPRLQQLKLARDGVKLFDSPAFRRAVIELRRHRHVAAHDLDVAATIRATIRQAGLFTPSFGRRRALPEYLLLIDRLSLPDEQAAVGDELARRLASGEIGVERYYFQGDARTCQQGPFAPALSLNELAARFPEHRLLIFGDGAGFFDAFSGEPQRWLEQFAQWPERALITPVEPGSDHRPDWGYREAWLQEQGFTLLPATANGFELLTEWLGSGLQQEPRDTAAHPYPPLLAERPKRWLERRLPRAAEAATLVAQLRRYLGESGWLWLRACAVYPQVTWELTLYLGARLLPAQGESWASDLLRLVRLPWFRYGTLPDWLRAVLIDGFTPEQNTQVRRVISDLLRHVLTNPAQAITLDVATEPPPEQTGWRRWLKRRELFHKLQTQPEESPLHDIVFLNFLAGRQSKPLAVQTPKLWARLFFESGKRLLGAHRLTWGLIAMGCSIILFIVVLFRPIQISLRHCPNSS